MPCPLCRKEFTIPEDGLSGIQKNFFMQDLLDVTNMFSRQGIHDMICRHPRYATYAKCLMSMILELGLKQQ